MEVKVISDTIEEFNGERFYLCGQYFQHNGKRLHRAVWEYHNGKIPNGCDIHHKDENRANNSIENLELLSSYEHHVIHAQSEAVKERSRKSMNEYARPKAIEWHKSKEGREWHSKHAVEIAKNRKINTYLCSFCGKEFQTKHTYPQGMNHFCHPNCKASFRRRRIRDEGKIN